MWYSPWNAKQSPTPTLTSSSFLKLVQVQSQVGVEFDTEDQVLLISLSLSNNPLIYVRQVHCIALLLIGIILAYSVIAAYSSQRSHLTKLTFCQFPQHYSYTPLVQKDVKLNSTTQSNQTWKKLWLFLCLKASLKQLLLELDIVRVLPHVVKWSRGNNGYMQKIALKIKD